MGLMTRTEFLRPAERRYRVVKLPTGGEVRLQSLTAGEMRQLKQSLINPDGKLNKKRGDRLQYLLLSWAIVDENGGRLFSEEDALSSDFDNIDGAIVSMIYDQAKNWTGFLSDGDFSAIEDAVKNSESTQES